jgi:heme oxygenase
MNIESSSTAGRARAETLDRLRAATRAHHARLEHRLGILDHLREPGRYRSLLAGFLGFYEPAEALLARWLSPLPALRFDARRKTHLLAADLRRLGTSKAELAAIPRHSGLAPLQSEAEALGFGYVLEGATLGGQVISRHAAAHGLDAAGLSFFRSYGAEVGPMWRRFCEILEMHCHGAEAQAGAVFGALQAFEHLEAWILQRTAAPGTATA